MCGVYFIILTYIILGEVVIHVVMCGICVVSMGCDCISVLLCMYSYVIVGALSIVRAVGLVGYVLFWVVIRFVFVGVYVMCNFGYVKFDKIDVGSCYWLCGLVVTCICVYSNFGFIYYLLCVYYCVLVCIGMLCVLFGCNLLL